MAPSRSPPVSMRKRLRKEVKFGCPICRSSFLTYHHFDPPWEPFHEHREKGIIALCSTCHRQADGGAYTKKQLHEMKANPSNIRPDGKLPWKFRKALIISGGNYFIAKKPQFLFRIAGRDVFSLSLKKNRYFSINALIEDENSALIAQIEQNDIITDIDKIGDLRCSTQAKEVYISSMENNVRFVLKFDRKDLETFISKVPDNLKESIRMESLNILDTDNLLPTIEVEFNAFGPGFEVNTTNKGLTTDFRQLGLYKANFTGKFFNEFPIKFNINGHEVIHIGKI